MGNYSLLKMCTIFGMAIGASVAFIFGFHPYIMAFVYAMICGAITTGIGYLLNEKGYLYTIYQVLNSSIMFIPFYLLYGIIVYMIYFMVTDASEPNNIIIGLTPIPFTILSVLIYIKRKNIVFERRVEVDGEYIEVQKTISTKKNAFRPTVPSKKTILYAFASIVIILFLLYIYPTMYKYDKLEQKYPVKINRLTGETYILNSDGWRKAE